LLWLDGVGDKEEAVIDFSGTIVYSPSFLEESFGGAIMSNKKNKDKFKHIGFVNIDDPIWAEKK